MQFDHVSFNLPDEQALLSLRARLKEIYVTHTGQPLERVANAVERDYFMSPDEAKEFGLIDDVIVSRPPRDAAGEESRR